MTVIEASLLKTIMTIRSFLTLLAIVTSTQSSGQKIGDHYVSISMDSTVNCNLIFLSDSTVSLSNISRHMGPRFAMNFKYITTDTSIEVLPGRLTTQDSLSLKGFGFNYFIKPFIILAKIKGGFIDYSKSLIYIRKKDFSNNPDIAYIIDGKTFIQDAGVTDGYGLVKRSPRTNKALQRKLKGLNKDNCNIELVRGLEAYKRLGIKRVYGAIIITTKE